MKNKSHIMMVLALLAAAGCTQAEMETPAEIAAAADGDILHARIESPSDPETKAYVAKTGNGDDEGDGGDNTQQGGGDNNNPPSGGLEG